MLLTVLDSAISLVLAGLGAWLSMRPPAPKHHWRLLSVFVLLGAVSVVINIRQQNESAKQQRQLGGQLSTIQKNTLQPPQVNVNVPPPTIIQSGPSQMRKLLSPDKVIADVRVASTGNGLIFTESTSGAVMVIC